MINLSSYKRSTKLVINSRFAAVDQPVQARTGTLAKHNDQTLFNSILFAINKKIQHKYIIDDTQYSYYYNIHT